MTAPPRPPAGKSLFSQHYLQHRLPDHAEWHDDPGPVFEKLRALWARARELGPSWNEAQTEDEFIRPILEHLGWKSAVQTKSQKKGSVLRPDYTLFTDQAAKGTASPHQGDDDAFYAHVAAIAEAKYWGRGLSQQDASGRNAWKIGSNPSHQMVSYLVGSRVPWGILTNGITWRLYSREASSVASDFYEVDLGLICDAPPAGAMPSDGKSGWVAVGALLAGITAVDKGAAVTVGSGGRGVGGGCVGAAAEPQAASNSTPIRITTSQTSIEDVVLISPPSRSKGSTNHRRNRPCSLTATKYNHMRSVSRREPPA
jgi:hypothetical protein